MSLVGLIKDVLGYVNLKKTVGTVIPGVVMAMTLAYGVSLHSDGGPPPFPVLYYSSILSGTPQSWYDRDVSRLEALTLQLGNSRARKAELDAALARYDRQVAVRDGIVSQLVAEYGNDLASGASRVASISSEIQSRLNQIPLSPSDGDRVNLLRRQVVAASVDRLSREVARQDSIILQRSAVTGMGASASSLASGVVVLTLLGLVLGSILQPLGRAMLEPQMAFRKTGLQLEHPPAFYIGMGVITRDEHEKIVDGYYRYAEIMASLVLPLSLFAILAYIDPVAGAGWSISAGLLAILAVFIAGQRYAQYRRRLSAHIVGKLKSASEARKAAAALEEAASKKRTRVKSVQDVALTLHKAREQAARLSTKAASSKAPELVAAADELENLIRRVSVEIESPRVAKVLPRVGAVLASAHALRAKVPPTSSNLAQMANEILASCAKIPTRYRVSVAKETLGSLKAQQADAKLLIEEMEAGQWKDALRALLALPSGP